MSQIKRFIFLSPVIFFCSKYFSSRDNLSQLINCGGLTCLCFASCSSTHVQLFHRLVKLFFQIKLLGHEQNRLLFRLGIFCCVIKFGRSTTQHNTTQRSRTEHNTRRRHCCSGWQPNEK